MAKIKFEITHQLSQQEALLRVKNLLGEVKSQFADTISNLSEEWNNNSGVFKFKAMGFSVSGTLCVTDKAVEIHGELPFAAIMLRGRIESAIRAKAETIFA